MDQNFGTFSSPTRQVVVLRDDDEPRIRRSPRGHLPPECCLRSHADIINKRVKALPHGFPCGPWVDHDFETAKNDIQKFCGDVNQGGGAFCVTWGAMIKPASKVAGRKRIMVCNRHRPASGCIGDKRVRGGTGTGCPWKLTLEDAEEGIVIKDFNHQDHNHDLAKGQPQVNAQASLRHIPQDLMDLGRTLRVAGQSPAEINEVLESAARASQREVTWTYMDVYNTYAYTAEDKLMDATNMDEYLIDRKDMHGLYYSMFHGHNDDGAGGRHLSRLCFEVDGAKDFWALESCPEINYRLSDTPSRGVSVLYDTTFNTNRGGLKLGLIIGVDQEGKTRILFVSMVLYQGTRDFQWVFEHLLKCFRVAPNVIFTDSDGAMASAISEVLPRTHHLLCTWHLSLNLNTNVQPATTKDQFAAIRKEWWKICKNSELLSRNTFDQEWEYLVSIIPLPSTDNADKMQKYKTAMTWLDKCKERRKRWAARWTWQHMTVGNT
jgi:hypothetical protein